MFTSRPLTTFVSEDLLDLAEICGIHAGDGYLRNDGKRCELDISGNYEEKEYYDFHVIPLFNKFFNLKVAGRFFLHRSTYGFVIRDRKVIEFMHEVVGFPYGAKTYIVDVPDFIKKDGRLMPRFLRGYFDTDGCVCFSKKVSGKYCEFKKTRDAYPRILLSTVSMNLGNSLIELLKLLDFKFYSGIEPPARINFHKKICIHINGVEGLNKWLANIGTCSSVKLSKIEIWQKFGFCPPHTKLEERQKILKGEISPESYYKGA